MFARISLLVVLMIGGLMFTASPVRAQEQPDASAAELYQAGMRLFAEGNYAEAKELLLRVDDVQLPKEDRVTRWETIQEIDRRIAQPSDTGAMLAQANDLNRRGRTAEAQALYEQVLSDPNANQEQKDAATARLAELSRRRNPDLARVRQLIVEAGMDIEAGLLDQAEAKLKVVTSSDVRLSSFDRGRVERQLAVLAERQAAAGVVPSAQPAEEPAAPASEAPATDALDQVRSLEVQSLVAEGQAAEQAGQFRTAMDAYRRALELEPNNAEIRDMLAAVTLKAGATPAEEGDLLGRHAQAQSIRRQEIIASYNQWMETARNSLQTADFPRAFEAVQQARLVLDNGQRLLPTTTYEQLRNEAVSLDRDIRRAEEFERIRKIEQTQAATTQAEIDAAEQLAEQREAEVQSLLQRVVVLRREQQYEQALVLLNQVLFLDPNNIAAQALKEMIEDSSLYREFDRLKRRRALEIVGQRLDSLEATTPYRDIIEYPADWPLLTQRRLSQFATAGEESDANRATRLQLRNSVAVNFEGVQLDLVIKYLRDYTGLNFFVNWPALEQVGVTQETPITLQLNNVPAEQALKLVLQMAAAGTFGEPIGYSVIDGIVTVSTLADLTRTTDIRLYDIRDLLVSIPNFTNAPEFDLETALDQSSDRGSGSGGGTSSSGGGSGRGGGLFRTDNEDEQEQQQSREERIAQILDLIQNSVGRPEDWEFYGGTVSSASELNGNLVIRTTPDNHREVLGLLGELREALALQISIEARFLAVSQNFLNEFAIDLDLNIAEGELGNNIGEVDIAQDTISLADRPTTILTPAAFGLISGGAEEEGAFRRSFQMGVSYLDDLEVNLLITATQASRRAISLTAPRLTLFNGQRAFVMVARQIAFISDLTPIPDTIGFDITPGVVNSGVVLDVEATVSADRRYVTLTLRPSLATVVQPIRQIPMSAAFLPPDDGGGGGGDQEPIVAEAFIELPEVELTTVRTTVSVPDRGTLLIGGQRLVGEIEIEAGVPVLSKIPILNRLFTNRSMVKDETTLLILVKPTIIIQSEEEDLRWPGLLDDPSRFGPGTGFVR